MARSPALPAIPHVDLPSAAWPEDWPQAWTEALDEASLLEVAGDKVYARGIGVFDGGAVEVLEFSHALPEPFVRAQVQGSELYETGMRLGAQGLLSHCSCPHAADGFFCKHQVALGLSWRLLLGGRVRAADPAAQKKMQALAKRAQTTAARAQALRDFLHAQPATVLADKLLEWADLLPELRRELRAWQALAEVAHDPASLKKAVTELLALRGFLEWRQCAAWAQGARRVLELLDETLARGEARTALQLAAQALRRLFAVLQQADDSDGEIGGLCEEVGERWVAALRALGPQPAAFGEQYAKLREDEVFEAISHKAAVEAMGPAAARRYGQLLRERWEAALAAAREARAGTGAEARRRRHDPEAEAAESRLRAAQWRYLDHLRTEGEAEEALRVLRADLHDASDHVSLIVELQRLKRLREALAAAEQAHRRFPQDWRIEELLIEGYERDGWDAEALALRRKRFERLPSPEGFFALLQAARRAGAEVEALRTELWQQLEAREQETLARERRQGGPWALPPGTGPDVSLRLAILLKERRMDEALALAQPPNRAQAEPLQQLALALPAAQHAAAAALLRRVFDARMPQATSPYTEVLALVRRIVERLPRDEGNAWVAQLRSLYKAKRNFVKGLTDV